MNASAKWTCIIVDDEPLARSRLHDLIVRDGRLELVGEASDPVGALALVAEREPDVIFLDIQLRGGDGFDVASSLSTQRPALVFVTAYDAFAVKAFEAQAFDYLVKPVEFERLERAISVSIERLEGRQQPTGSYSMPDVLELLRTMRTQSLRIDRLSISVGRRTLFVAMSEIERIEADGNYSRIFIGGKSMLARGTLAHFEARLDATRFIRVHRSTVVNLARISAYEPLANGDSRLTMASGASVVASRTYRTALMSSLPLQG